MSYRDDELRTSIWEHLRALADAGDREGLDSWSSYLTELGSSISEARREALFGGPLPVRTEWLSDGPRLTSVERQALAKIVQGLEYGDSFDTRGFRIVRGWKVRAIQAYRWVTNSESLRHSKRTVELEVFPDPPPGFREALQVLGVELEDLP